MQNMVIQLLVVFIVGLILKAFAGLIFGYGVLGIGIGVLIDISVLGYIYLILRRYRYLNIRKFMAVFGGITLVSILVDVGVLRGDIGNLIVLGVAAWLLIGRDGFFRGGRGRLR